ncbi:GH39 family glycosyl hydrolase [Puia sp.]|uniref:GH39 family glycosyl hydrolase n=1 Tax=Puia sp. TaxID=2045100 RepID=UPI002D8053EE|nr:beta-xylosidase [Puia sp.]
MVNGSLLVLAGICASAQTITIDYTKQTHPQSHFWAYFGYDEPNFTYMRDGKKLLSELAALSPVPVYVRCHNLLTTGDGTPALKWGSTNAYTEDAAGNPIYNWRIADSIFDTYVHRGMKPLAEIGFMPEALSVHPVPYRHHWHPGTTYDTIFTGWAYPPKSYEKWAALVGEWVRHCVQRYGAKEVATWRWEVWNEPDIPYWKGTEEEYFKLYDYAAFAVKKALPEAQVGGPATTGPRGRNSSRWLREFLGHCAAAKVPLDFISFHAKGSPKFIDGHVRMNMAPQLADVTNGFAIVRASAFSRLPIYITECDPEGCAACGMTTNPENAYRNGTMYSSYTAASFARIAAIADSMQVNLAAAMSWAFEFEGQRYFDGFRDLATNGIDKPVLNVFRMFGLMRGNRIPVDSAFVTADAHAMYILVWNYTDDDLPGPSKTMDIQLTDLPGKKIKLTQYRIDEAHSNSYEAWKKMGSPQNPTPHQYQTLEAAGLLQRPEPPKALTTPHITVSLPAHAVALLKLEWASAAP